MQRGKMWLIVAISVLAGMAHAQYTTVITLTPASTAMPCPASKATPTGWILCPQNGSVTIDFGDGKGYVPDGAGQAATVTVGTVITGTPASVKNVGTPSAAILNFVLPPGAAGANGVNGATGATGATGPPGTMPTTFSCTSMTVTATGVTLGGCK
jgi:hypothetical protein